jgi:glycosyltransferase involved in cell wall biosynthesis
MKKVLVVCDVRNWAFENLFKALKKNLVNWDINSVYTTDGPLIKHALYDVILFLCDYQVGLIKWNRMPKEKTILAIRSNVKLSFYDKMDLNEVASIIAVANNNLKNRFDKLHKNVVLAPGGVDTDIFKFQPKPFSNKIKIGWSGSRSNFGSRLRGLDIVKQACEEERYRFTPAFREDKWRTPEEMNEYYHNEIDIYVDMSFEAGRQNGLLEAAACGVPVISSKSGFAEQLIRHNETGFLCERNAESLKEILKLVLSKPNDYLYKMFEHVKRNWSWKVQSKIFEKMFEKIVNEER